MSVKSIISLIVFTFQMLLPVASEIAFAKTENLPNIVWLVSEDNTVDFLRLYNPSGIELPNIERLAAQGVVFNHAYSNAPVCSVARSTLISGRYAPGTLTQFHRKIEASPMPDELKMFPWYLRQEGYYTSNNDKEDYNYIKHPGVWDESSNHASYRNRSEGQPFFHVQNFGITHEGQLHFGKAEIENTPTSVDPDTITSFPYLPDTRTVRYSHARYLDFHSQLDKQIGAFVEQLQADGVLEDTIIFYFGDNGGVLPGSKGYLYERGVHVPLVVSIPEKWQHLFPVSSGSRINGFVSFVDFAPTMLNLAGIEIPTGYDGKAFLGKEVSQAEIENRDTVFCYADRMDEKCDTVRSIRKGNLKYIRSFMPFNMDGLQNNYRYKMLAYQEWRELYGRGHLTVEQSLFFQSRQPESLYDLDKDPFELRNLADDSSYKTELLELRNMLLERMLSMPDYSLFPEAFLLRYPPYAPKYAELYSHDRISGLLQTADLCLQSFSKVKSPLEEALKSEDPMIRYHATMVCTIFSAQSLDLKEEIAGLLENDPENLVRLRAAQYLAIAADVDTRDSLVRCFDDSDSSAEALLVLNVITSLLDCGVFAEIDLPEMLDEKWESYADPFVDWRYQYLAENYLRK